jgi:phosphate transport system permease protein
MKKFKEKLSGRIFFLFALTSITALAVITLFIFREGMPMLPHVFSGTWAPNPDAELGQFGILPMIVGTVAVTLGAALIGVPIGICCAIFMAELAPERMRNIFRPAIQLLAGIPSVVYGFWGMIFVVPFIRNHLGGPGLSIVAGSIVLSLMMLPTIISISEVSILALPKTYKEGALALGMTHWQTIRSVQLPAAKSGIVAAVILGMGRAVGETMAVIMVLGNAVAFPTSVLDPVRTLTTNIGIEMGYAQDAHRQALFATGIVLFVIIMALNITAQTLTRKRIRKD